MKVKRLTALLCLALFLFNLAGYRVFFHYLQKESDEAYQISLNQSRFDASQMIMLTVDMNMPYLPADTDFESVNGEITVDGKLYKYVKRKVQNGQLVLLCLPDHNRNRIESSKQEFFAYANSLNAEQNKQAPTKSAIKAFAVDYDQFDIQYKIENRIATTHYELPQNEHLISSVQCKFQGQPPERL